MCTAVGVCESYYEYHCAFCGRSIDYTDGLFYHVPKPNAHVKHHLTIHTDCWIAYQQQEQQKGRPPCRNVSRIQRMP